MLEETHRQVSELLTFYEICILLPRVNIPKENRRYRVTSHIYDCFKYNRPPGPCGCLLYPYEGEQECKDCSGEFADLHPDYYTCVSYFWDCAYRFSDFPKIQKCIETFLGKEYLKARQLSHPQTPITNTIWDDFKLDREQLRNRAAEILSPLLVSTKRSANRV